MRLKTKLVLLITGLVFVVVGMISWMYLDQLFEIYLNQSYTTTTEAAHQVLFATRQAIALGLRGQTFDIHNPESVRAAVAKALRSNQGLNSLINSIIDYSPTVFDISIADKDGRALLSEPNPALNDHLLPKRPSYDALRSLPMLRALQILFGTPQVYNVQLGLDLSGKPFLSVRVGIRTTFLKNVIDPWLIESLSLIALALLAGLIAAALLANLALAPITAISRRLDLLEEAEAAAAIASLPAASTADVVQRRRLTSSDAVAQVSGKIERIGRRMRNVEEVFTTLQGNLNQMLARLQDGMILFTRDARAILVSNAVERFLGQHRDTILGAEVREIFDRDTLLGRLVRDAFEAHMSIVQEEITTANGHRVQVSLDFIHDEQSPTPLSLGALLTLHDLESLHEIESELEISRRMAAIGRLTAGVGHEVKNPIHAIVLHLELLRNKMDLNTSAGQHLEIIESEIRRLDRVVQTLVDFSRPVELKLRDQDLRPLVERVLTLAEAELVERNILLASSLPAYPVMVKIDADLTTQALLNVVLNGAQAMPAGGTLTLELFTEGRWALMRVHDCGTGIAPEVLPYIFDLYYTTKKEGSGIGLAMTYRILQFQNGRIDVKSSSDVGTTFSLYLPWLGAAEPPMLP